MTDEEIEKIKLIDKLNLQNQRLNELKKENEELFNSITELTNTKTELENKVTELEKQIEKMKNCLNCKWCDYSKNDNYCFCMLNPPDNKRLNLHCNDWELAE